MLECSSAGAEKITLQRVSEVLQLQGVWQLHWAGSCRVANKGRRAGQHRKGRKGKGRQASRSRLVLNFIHFSNVLCVKKGKSVEIEPLKPTI